MFSVAVGHAKIADKQAAPPIFREQHLRIKFVVCRPPSNDHFVSERVEWQRRVEVHRHACNRRRSSIALCIPPPPSLPLLTAPPIADYT